MQKMQVQSSRLTRFGLWLWRHKVLTIFGILVLAVGGTLLVWQVQWTLQIRAEKKQYMSVKGYIDNLSGQIASRTGAKPVVKHTCTATSDGTVFGHENLGCGSEIEVAYSGLSMDDAERMAQSVKQIVVDSGVSLSRNDGGKDANDLDVYVFDKDNIGCGFTEAYYDSSVIPSSRGEGAPPQGSAFYTSLGCGGNAKEPYFPLTN